MDTANTLHASMARAMCDAVSDVGTLKGNATMSNELTTTTTAHDVSIADAAPVLQWATKTGKFRTAFTAASAARGNRAARLAAADGATLRQLQNNTFRPFLKDVASKLTTAQTAALRSHVSAALSVTVEGVTMAPAGDVLASANKRVALAVVDFLQAPYAVVKGVVTVKPLSKAAQYLGDIAQAWADAMAAQEAPQVDNTDVGTDTLPDLSEALHAAGMTNADPVADGTDAEFPVIDADAMGETV